MENIIGNREVQPVGKLLHSLIDYVH